LRSARCEPAQVQPMHLTLPTDTASGVARNDVIPVVFFAAAAPDAGARPEVVLLHSLGDRNNQIMYRVARYLARRGIAGAVMVLPYHMQRPSSHDCPLRHFLSRDADAAVQAFRQSASDVSAVVTWLRRKTSVDPNRIGVVRVSLGAAVAHLGRGLDGRLTAGVAVLGGGNLADTYRRRLLSAANSARAARV